MPIYEYQCTDCGQSFEFVQNMDEEALILCPECGEPTLKKMISASAFHLKGTGWYVTDFKNSAKPNTEKQKQENKTETGSKSSAEKESAKKAPAVETKTSDTNASGAATVNKPHQSEKSPKTEKE